MDLAEGKANDHNLLEFRFQKTSLSFCLNNDDECESFGTLQSKISFCKFLAIEPINFAADFAMKRPSLDAEEQLQGLRLC